MWTGAHCSIRRYPVIARSEATKQSSVRTSVVSLQPGYLGAMDCFASLAMTETYFLISRAPYP